MPFDVSTVLDEATNTEKWKLLSGVDFWHTAPLARFQVPSVRVTDGPNGIRGTRFFAGVPAACIPCGTALGATWDKALLRRAGELLGNESVAKGAHCWLGPTINIQRSPLGGRGFESFAEDPHLSGILAAHIIRGCESTGVQACPKHFVCNDQEHERRAVNTIVTERALREVYLRPFQIIARDAPSGCLMTSYNKINGTHVSHDARLLDDIVRKEWKWNPLIMSDWFGTVSTVQSMNAGLDLEMPGPSRWRNSLGDFTQSSRLIKQSVLDERARRVLQFVDRAAQLTVSSIEGERNYPEDRILNRELSAASVVLLKNEQGILPLSTKINKLALIGSHMKIPAISGGGSAALQPYYATSLFDAISERFEGTDTEVVFEVGAYAHKMLPVVSQLARTPDRQKSGSVIRFFNQPASVLDRECVGTEYMPEIHAQLMDYKNEKLNFDLFYAQVEAIFTPDQSGVWDFGLSVYGTANVYLDNELIIDETTQDQVGGGAFFGKGTKERLGSKLLDKGTEYMIKVEFGSAATSKVQDIGVVTFGGGGVRLGCCLNIEAEDAIQRACKIAETADAVVLCTGLNGDWESEGYDRSHMSLPDGIDSLISRVLSANPNTVIVTQSGTPFSMPWIDKASTVMHGWYGGNEVGHGIADCLFGDHNPSGRLPLSWPKHDRDNPSHLNFGSVGGRVLYGEDIYVGYKYYDARESHRDLQFCFGFGLSYTTFCIQPLSTTRTTVRVRVTNQGATAGSETVQVYISPPMTGLRQSRPKKELHGFTKIHNLLPGDSKEADIDIDRYAGCMWDEDEERWVLESGQYTVWVGRSSSSEDLVEAGCWEVLKPEYWRGV